MRTLSFVCAVALGCGLLGAEAPKEPSGLKEENKKLKAELESLKKKISELEGKLLSLRKENEQLRAELEQLKKKYAPKEEKVNVEEIKKLIARFRGTNQQRFEAEELIVYNYGKKATPFLLEALKTAKHPFVKQSAIRVLDRIKDERAVPALIELLKGVDPDMRVRANNALCSISGQYFGSVEEQIPADQREKVYQDWKNWWAKRQKKKKPEEDQE